MRLPSPAHRELHQVLAANYFSRLKRVTRPAEFFGNPITPRGLPDGRAGPVMSCICPDQLTSHQNPHPVSGLGRLSAMRSVEVKFCLKTLSGTQVDPIRGIVPITSSRDTASLSGWDLGAFHNQVYVQPKFISRRYNHSDPRVSIAVGGKCCASLSRFIQAVL